MCRMLSCVNARAGKIICKKIICERFLPMVCLPMSTATMTITINMMARIAPRIAEFVV